MALPASLSLSRSLSPNFLLTPGSGGLLAIVSQWKMSVALGLVVAAVSRRLSLLLIRVETEQPAECACL